jgi:uncharacterized UPF0160 family protein
MQKNKIYKIELASSDDFEILHAESDEEIFRQADEIDGGYLNIFEVDENYDEIRQVY